MPRAASPSTYGLSDHTPPVAPGPRNSFIEAGSDSFQVASGAGVDADAIALVDEQRDLDGGARLQGGGLGHAGHRVTADSRLGLRDLELERDRQLDADHLGLVAEQVDRLALFQEGEHVADV